MLTVISPAKTLDFDTPAKSSIHTMPDFLPESRCLIEQLRKLAPHEISTLMGISDKLGALNYDRFQQWSVPFTPENAKQAVLAFKGDVYTGLEAESFKSNDYKFAQKHLRILSGLYGLLRPMDLMQAYRLEMGTKFEHDAGKGLYTFWDTKITEALNTQLKQIKSSTLINLASNEYFKAIKPAQLDAEIITPVFKDLKSGKYKVVSFFAKKARGLMSAFIIKNKLTKAEQILDFCGEGYEFNKTLSNPKEWVFTRDE